MSVNNAVHNLRLRLKEHDVRGALNVIDDLETALDEVVRNLVQAHDDAYYRPEAQDGICCILEQLMTNEDFVRWLNSP